jgi:hypothetical protein
MIEELTYDIRKEHLFIKQDKQVRYVTKSKLLSLVKQNADVSILFVNFDGKETIELTLTGFIHSKLSIRSLF